MQIATESMTEPLVSVIIPMYNSAEYISQTLDSILGQTWQNIEIIIIDDGSIDNSIAIVNAFANQKIKVFRQQHRGACAARNKGLLEASGDYIQFLDADDLLEKDKIKLQIAKLSDHPNSIIFGSCINFRDENSLYANNAHLHPSISEFEKPIELIKKVYGCYKNIPGSMIEIHSWLTPIDIIRKIGAWNEELTVNDDGEYFLRVILGANKVIYMPDAVVFYRKTNLATLSTMRNFDSYKSAIKALDIIRDTLKGYLTQQEYFYCFYKSYKGLGIRSYPQHKDLSRYCTNTAQRILNSTDLDDDVKIELGGEVINFIANYISWKFARILQHYKTSLSNFS